MSIHIEHLDEVVDEFAGRLGRHVEHDSRSLEHAVEHVVDELLPPASVEWRRWSPILDQGDVGSCTGNAMTGWLGCEPHVRGAQDGDAFDEDIALQLYELATRLDNIAGQYPPDDTGSSGLAVAKAARKLGYIHAYGHALSVPGLLHALQVAPVIVGVPWFSGFDQADHHGTPVQAVGQIRGGHEFLVRGYEHGASEHDSYLLADNSWGTSWGDAGSFRFSVSTWRVLAANSGDITIPKA